MNRQNNTMIHGGKRQPIEFILRIKVKAKNPKIRDIYKEIKL